MYNLLDGMNFKLVTKNLFFFHVFTAERINLFKKIFIKIGNSSNFFKSKNFKNIS